MSSIARIIWFWELFFGVEGGEVYGGGRVYWGSRVEAQVALCSLVCWLARQLFVLSSV